MSTDGNGSKTLKVTDRRSPFFLHPSDNPGIMLMNVVLRGDSNYETWAKAMKNALKAKNKLGFINGTILQPDDSESDEGFAWGPNNSMINGWIHNTIDPQLQPFIPYFDTAKELWDDIKERYAVQNIPRQYQLKSSLATTKQAGSSVQNYYTKLQAVWDELESSRTVPACPSGDACPVTKWVSEETQRDHVYQFLMGLDGVFGNLRTQILSTTPLPSVNRLYSMAAQEETHKAIARGCEERVEAVGYAVQAMSKVAAVPSVSKVADGLGGNKIERVICTHCGKPNHDVSKCFQLHGYTNKGKGKAKGKGTQHHVTAHAVQAIADGGSGSSGAVGVTDTPVLTGDMPCPAESRRATAGPNGYSSVSERTGFGSREDLTSRYTPERFVPPSANDHSSQQVRNMNYMSRDTRNVYRTFDWPPPTSPPARGRGPSLSQIPHQVLPEERLRKKSIEAIKEYYSAKDEKEVAMCIMELNAPSFYPSMISIWVNDSFERKDLERDLLAKLLVNLAKSHDAMLNQDQLVKGFESVLGSLEDTVTDAPKAAEFLGRILARVVLESAIPYVDVWRLIHEGGEEQGRLVEIGLAAEVVGVILEIIKSEKGDPFLSEMRASSNLRVENFRPPGSKKAWRIDKFI